MLPKLLCTYARQHIRMRGRHCNAIAHGHRIARDAIDDAQIHTGLLCHAVSI